jgi:hypothetical protein
MENMRREGYEFEVGPPKVITKTCPDTGGRLEPMEEAVVEVPEEHVGQVVDLMGQRKAQMIDMSAGGRAGGWVGARVIVLGLGLGIVFLSAEAVCRQQQKQRQLQQQRGKAFCGDVGRGIGHGSAAPLPGI